MTSDLRLALALEFKLEERRLRLLIERSSPLDATMRLRALTSIADALSTEALVSLAAELKADKAR